MNYRGRIEKCWDGFTLIVKCDCGRYTSGYYSDREPLLYALRAHMKTAHGDTMGAYVDLDGDTYSLPSRTNAT